MMKALVNLLFFTLISMVSLAQIPLPYYTGFNNDAELSEWEQYRVGEAMDPNYEWNFYGDQMNHSYPVGGDEITDDWMVSPEFDFSNGVIIDSLRFKSAGFGTPFGLDTIALYHISGNANPDLAANKTLLKLFTDEDFLNDNLWKTFYDIEIPSTSGSSYIGFRYKTIINWFDVSFDDISISEPLGISDVDLLAKQIYIYPNPANDLVILNSMVELKVSQLSLVDGIGQTIREFNPLLRALDLGNLGSGLYILKIRIGDNVINKKMIIEQ